MVMGERWCDDEAILRCGYLLLVLCLASFVATPACFMAGCTMIIREKFSPAAFWSDVQQFGCTAMIHIGEIWRYLFNRPVCAEERNNSLRVIMGKQVTVKLNSE
jgi:hypothetical protein